MENEKSEGLQKLLASLQPYPNMRFLLFCEEWGAKERTIGDFCLRSGHELQVYTLSREIPQDGYGKHIRVSGFRSDRRRYDIQGRLYEYAFIECDMDDMEVLLEKLYPAMANAGIVYIDTAYLDKEKIPKLKDMSERCNYIGGDFMDPGTGSDYFYCRKMHGWGP
jgi:hypothetical protein